MASLVAVIKKAMGFASPISRQIAKERLSIMLVHQRSSNVLSEIDMQAFQKEIQGVVRKFLKVSPDKAPQITVRPDGDLSMLEINFALDTFTSSRR